ncbi:unnamed protein product [Clonostachys rosea f. rosea IK726]|uniref:Uncharacterized protein n=1 Tax=Clonostachys rosea f. rosea IK726 TaxID=1349383 RepID=A0ACA9U8B2_BIOOC|nr:unnamed protein product [Clonostachys rosea f. rosea IK726]
MWWDLQEDGLIYLSTMRYTMTAIDTKVGAASKMFDVNVLGPMRMVHHFHDLLISASGTIVNIGSVGGIVPYVYGSSYNATKAALHHWSNTLRVEMAPLRHVISGNIGTNILKSDQKENREIPQIQFNMALDVKLIRKLFLVTTDRFDYASRVVSQSLQSSPAAWFWYGKTTWLVRFLDAFFCRTIWDSLLWRMFDFGKLKRTHDLAQAMPRSN